MVNIIFAFTPLSFFGFYTDTVFLIATFTLIILTVTERVKNKKDKTFTALFIFCLLPLGFFIYSDLDFYQWGLVHRGTVKSIEETNDQSTITTTVYYQLNDNNEVGPGECRYWEKKTLKYFPIFEWTAVESYNCCGEIEELK